MSTPIKIGISTNAQEVLRSVRSFPPAMLGGIAKAMDIENELTVGHIVEARATGKGPFPVDEGKLGVRSGRYRRAVRPSDAVIVGAVVESAIGSNLRYAGAHEDGFQGTVPVREFTRRQHTNDILQGSGRRGFTARQPRERILAQGIARVKPHTMKMNIPARAPIGRGIADRSENYTAAVSRAIVKAWETPSP